MKDNTAILVTSDSQSHNMDALDAMDTRQRIQKMATTKISQHVENRTNPGSVQGLQYKQSTATMEDGGNDAEGSHDQTASLSKLAISQKASLETLEKNTVQSSTRVVV